MATPRPNYWDYLRLDQLLALQGGLEGDDEALAPDELHFIIVHQVFELWFKLVLRELRLARDYLAAPHIREEQVPYVVHHLRRVDAIMRHAVDQFAIMETLTPQDFLAFRDKLVPASGFQSFQMREIEILLGIEDAARVAEGGLRPLQAIRGQASKTAGGRLAVARLDAAEKEESLLHALRAWLYRTPIDGSRPGDPGDDAAVAGFVERYLSALEASQAQQLGSFTTIPDSDPQATQARFSERRELARAFLMGDDAPDAERPRTRRVRAGLLFIEAYRQLPLLAWPRLLIDAVVELEEQFVLWRFRHARMVERVIGRRVGTGGSSGVDYLDATTRYRVFTELWTVRTLLLPKDDLPPLAHEEVYRFAGEGQG